MSTLEEKAKEYLKKNTNIQIDTARAMLYNCEGKDLLRWLSEFTKKEREAYASQQVKEALERAAEKARMNYHCGTYKNNRQITHIRVGVDNITIDKSSILSLIKEYSPTNQ